MTTHDAPAVRALFAATAALGSPLVLPAADLAAYSALCLDYYLQEDARGCAVHLQDGQVTGYLLMALDHAAFLRWGRPRAARWAARAAIRSAWPRSGTTAGFHRRRLQDGVVTLLGGVAAPMPAHAHVNVARGARGMRAGLALVGHADVVALASGVPGFFGEVNVPRRKPGRAAAMQRLGGVVVHRQPNHTMSWLAGEPVDRLTVVRTLGRPAPGPRTRPRA